MRVYDASMITNISQKIYNVRQKIERNGLEDSTDNLFHKFKNDNIQAIKSIELQGIQAVEEKYQYYDSVFIKMKDLINDFKDRNIQKLSDAKSSNGVNAINKDMESIKESMQGLLDTKIGDLKLFDKKTFMVIGDNIKAVRSFDKSWITKDGKELTDIMKEIINNPSPNLEDIDSIMDFLNEKHTDIGSRWQGVKSTKAVYENISKNSDNFFKKRKKIEEAFMELENLTLNYQAMSKVIAKISSLSLVNYV